MTQEGFETFYESTVAGMRARAIMLCRHPQDAEDAVAEAYMKALQRWDRISGYDAPEAWVYRVMQRRLWRLADRRVSPRPAEELDGPTSMLVPELELAARRVLDALATLPPRQRVVLVLHCLCGLSQDEVKAELGLRSRNTVAAHLFKARRTLARILDLAPPPVADPVSPEYGLASAGLADPLVVALADTARQVRAWVDADTTAAPRIRRRIATELGSVGGWRRRRAAAR